MPVAASLRITLEQVARRAGVSVATASSALNGRSDRERRLPAPTLARVVAVAESLGYRGDAAVRALRRQRTELVAVAYCPPVGPWLDALITQCEETLAERGYSVVGIPVRRPERAEQSLRILEFGYVDGVIVTGGLTDPRTLENVKAAVDAVVVFDEHRAPDGFDVVRRHERRAVAQATRHLVEQGRRRIAYLHHGDAVHRGTQERFRGFKDGLRATGQELHPELVRAGASYRQEAMATVRELLSLPQPPDALIAESDRSALAAIQVSHACGLWVPDDLAVIGTGNTAEAEVSSPPLTSVGTAQLDFTSVVHALFSRIDDPDLPGRVLRLPWQLNLRDTA